MRLFDSLGLVVHQNPGAVYDYGIVGNGSDCRGIRGGILCGDCSCINGGVSGCRIGYGIGERIRRILYVFHNLYRIGNEFGKRLAFNISTARNHKVGAAGKAGAAQASGRIVEYHKAHFAHPFFGIVARARHERFVISVDGDCRHFRAGGQFFEQSIVAHAVHLFGGNVGEVTAEQQVVGLNGIDLRNKAFELLGAEQRVYMNVAKENGGKVFVVLARQFDSDQVRLVFIVVLHAVANEYERKGASDSKQVAGHAAHQVTAQVMRLRKIIDNSIESPGNVNN